MWRRLRSIKWVYQRARYGVSDNDCWNLDAYLAGILSRGTKWLDDYGNGFQCCLPVEHPGGYDPKNECWNVCPPIWSEIMQSASHVFGMLAHGEFWKDKDGKIIPDYVDSTSQYDIDNEIAYHKWSRLFLGEYLGALWD